MRKVSHNFAEQKEVNPEAGIVVNKIRLGEGVDAFIDEQYNESSGNYERVLRIEMPGYPINFQALCTRLQEISGLEMAAVEPIAEDTAMSLARAGFIRALSDHMM